VVNGLDILRGEVAHTSVATALPALGVGAVQQVDEVAAQEWQLGGLLRRKVEQSGRVVRPLQRGGGVGGGGREARGHKVLFNTW